MSTGESTILADMSGVESAILGFSTDATKLLGVVGRLRCHQNSWHYEGMSGGFRKPLKKAGYFLGGFRWHLGGVHP